MKYFIFLVMSAIMICFLQPIYGLDNINDPTYGKEMDQNINKMLIQYDHNDTDIDDLIGIDREVYDIPWWSVVGFLSPNIVVTSNRSDNNKNTIHINIIELIKKPDNVKYKKENIFTGSVIRSLVVPGVGLFVYGNLNEVNGRKAIYPIYKILNNGDIDKNFYAEWSLGIPGEYLKLYDINGKLLVYSKNDDYYNSITSMIIINENGQIHSEFTNPNSYLNDIGYYPGQIKKIIGKKIYILARRENDMNLGDPATLFRFYSDGSPDETFNPIVFRAQSIVDIYEQTTGKIVIGGGVICGGIYEEYFGIKWFYLIRFENNGELDDSFIKIDNNPYFKNNEGTFSGVKRMIMLNNDDIVIMNEGLFLVPMNGSLEIGNMLLGKKDFGYCQNIYDGFYQKYYINYRPSGSGPIKTMCLIDKT